MNKNLKMILIIILVIGIILLVSYFIMVNIIKNSFVINEVQLENSEFKKEKYLKNQKNFLSSNIFYNMSYKDKEDFLNNPEQYDCYKLIINIKNSSLYKADVINIKYKNNIKDLWVDEDCDTIVPYYIDSNSERKITTGVICKKGALEKNKIDFDLIFYIDCPILGEVKISY